MAPGSVSSCGDGPSRRGPMVPALLWPLDTRRVRGEGASPGPSAAASSAGPSVCPPLQSRGLCISHAPSVSSSPMHLLVGFFFSFPFF